MLPREPIDIKVADATGPFFVECVSASVAFDLMETQSPRVFNSKLVAASLVDANGKAVCSEDDVLDRIKIVEFRKVQTVAMRMSELNPAPKEKEPEKNSPSDQAGDSLSA
ncbi:MAG TPA: hypothetical protein VJU83_11525 [Burkholderiales bacterium]|nr:hypothetical protein [Burkholderiales bacterium]